MVWQVKCPTCSRRARYSLAKAGRSDLFDTRTKQLLWRGSANDTLSDNSTTNIKNLDKGVEKMFKQLPMGSSKK
jgi:uncharacterized protein DUF4136